MPLIIRHDCREYCSEHQPCFVEVIKLAINKFIKSAINKIAKVIKLASNNSKNN